MGTPVETDDAIRAGAQAADRFTAVPHWTRTPAPGFAACEVTVPEDVVRALDRLGDELEVRPQCQLLAAHAKVLAALSGESEVVTGYIVFPGGKPSACRLTTAPPTWRALLSAAQHAVDEIRSRSATPAGAYVAGPSRTGRPGAVLDPTGGGDEGGSAESTDDVDAAAFRMTPVRREGRTTLRLRYRTDVLDAEGAARIAGYHLTALTLMATAPDAAHHDRSLLSAEELHLQLHGLAGPRRTLPDQRFHELFEQRVRAHPDAVAAEYGDRRWTYRELNVRANRLAHALLAAGLRRQDVVAVVSERNLDWLAAVLAIFKATGVYMPVEPHFPAERVTAMLTRASCGLVLTDAGSTGALDRVADSPAAIRVLAIDEICARSRGDDNTDTDADADTGNADSVTSLDTETRADTGLIPDTGLTPDTDPGLDVAPDDLAYVYFTSGSTGEPKGAMCAHEGMLNHLYAKIDDLGIREGEVVAQTAPQCFDISLWQLLAALLTGGRTRLVPQEAVLDIRRYLDTIVEGRVGVVQMVPSYLDVVLSFLEQNPRELPDVHCVSVTGEALHKGLVERWFAAFPRIRLVNAYGLTETSDDTNHEVMEAVPGSDRIPLGRPITNVRVYVVDENLSPVPLGAPGEIVFSGVCVGHGYINDPERTRRSFLADPHRPGERLYRSGDQGRWLPGGKLEFLGRQDAQVKVSGFRIEIGEIETTLLRMPGVRDGAVVVTGRDGRGQHLVAFCTGRRPADDAEVQHRLGRTLPAYMVPSVVHWRDSLPLTGNGKTDKKALAALAVALDAAQDRSAPPRTPGERRVAAAWATALGVSPDRIGRRDSFFDHGGTSLTAVKVVVSLDRALSLKDLIRHPVLADQAELLDGRGEREPGPPDTSSASDRAPTHGAHHPTDDSSMSRN